MCSLGQAFSRFTVSIPQPLDLKLEARSLMASLPNDGGSYFLPSHPSFVSNDPLSICDTENPSWWDLITHAIGSFRQSDPTLSQLSNLIKDLVYSLHGNGHMNFGFLDDFIAVHYPNHTTGAGQRVLDGILDSALALPILFPTNTIRYLSPSCPSIEFSDSQIKSLLSHQILGTFAPPQGNTWGCTFIDWFKAPQPVERAISGYILTLFRYLGHSHPNVMFEFCTLPLEDPTLGFTPWTNCHARLFDHLVIEAVSTSDVRFPHDQLDCTLVSCSASPGFGASCTQEELITGACPALLPLGAVCILPPLPTDACLLATNVVPTTSWKGQGREAHVTQIIEEQRPHSFLFCDALELDLVDGTSLADLLSPNFTRDLNKALTGFASLGVKGIKKITSPLWGAGSFGGNAVVKALILAMAGARVGVTITLAVDEARCEPTDVSLSQTPEHLITLMRGLVHRRPGMTVAEAWAELTSPTMRTCRDGREVVEHLVVNHYRSSFME